MPACQLLVQLHQQVLLKLHMQLGKGLETAKVYYAAMAAFNTTDSSTNQCPHTASCIQTMLLMAQNGLPGLSVQGCELLLEAVDKYSEDWVRRALVMRSLTKLRLFPLGTKSWQLQEMLSPFL